MTTESDPSPTLPILCMETYYIIAIIDEKRVQGKHIEALSIEDAISTFYHVAVTSIKIISITLIQG